MKFVIDIIPSTMKRVNELLARTDYGSLGVFVGAAIENQLLLEESETNGIVSPIQKDIIKPSLVDLRPIVDKLSLGPVDQPMLRHTLEAPTDENIIPGPLWGGFYRLFPAKLAVRVFVDYFKDEYPKITDFNKEVVDFALQLGQYFRQKDEKESRKYGEKTAVVFPHLDGTSIKRFKALYLVVKRPRDGRLDGLMGRLKFINVSEGKVGITKAGLEFAKLENPLFDGGFSEPGFSDSEIRFLLGHIQANLIDEFSDMGQLTCLVQKGIRARKEINEKMGKYYEKKYFQEKRWSDKVIATMTAGLTSRLVEIHVLQKEKSAFGSRLVPGTFADKLLEGVNC